MKGFQRQTNYQTKKHLTQLLVLKSLPYGKWTTKKSEEYLFNRDYEPISGWDLRLNKPIPVSPIMWIHEIEETELYYSGRNYPIHEEKILRKCWDILADWSRREIDNKI